MNKKRNLIDKSNRQKRIIIDSIRNILLMSGAAIMLFPLLWVISTAFKTQQDAISFPPHFIPKPVILNNFSQIFSQSPFLHYMLNSIFVSGMVVVGALFFCSLTGYVLARYSFTGSRIFFVMVLGKLIIPGQVLVVPLYLLMIKLGWTDSLISLIVPTDLMSAFGIFLMRQFIISFPGSIFDASAIDGCGEFGTYWRIVIPNMKHAIFTLGIFLFVWSWSDFLWPMIVIDTPEKMTIQVGLARFSSQYFEQYGPKMAGVLISIVPVIALFLGFQRRVLESVALSGIKE